MSQTECLWLQTNYRLVTHFEACSPNSQSTAVTVRVSPSSIIIVICSQTDRRKSQSLFALISFVNSDFGFRLVSKSRVISTICANGGKCFATVNSNCLVLRITRTYPPCNTSFCGHIMCWLAISIIMAVS